ncbi:MAG TPA: hypothetical protein DCQ06_00495, partial [Myxococcales bacterium]|nr:hypothetical protein [Myxococcales bacterium]
MKAQTLSLLPARVRSVVRCGWWLPIVAVWIAGCALEPRNAPIIAPLLSDGVEVVLPNDTHAGLVLAAEDVSKAIAALNGGKIKQTVFGPVSDASTRVVVFVEVLTNPPDAVGAQGFEISRQAWGGQRVGLRIRARTAVGAMYGLFTLAHDLGVRYLHPEETFWPAAAADASLPWQYPGDASNPSFGFRGLHEHTQHPTPASDFLLKPDDPTMASYASRWLQWIARNRNNVASFHLLKTVPLKSWVGAFGKLVKQAHSYGIKIGFVTSFADQQQNNYKHIDELDKGADGKPKPDDQQIRSSLDTLLSTGIDWIGFQLGTSEFSKPKDSRVMSWIEVALAHISTTAPGVKAYAWIHTTCNLLDEKGGYYYHLPL